MNTDILLVIFIVLLVVAPGRLDNLLMFGGWALVVIIPIALLVLIVKGVVKLLRPVVRRTSKNLTISMLRRRIQKRSALGYETTELEAELKKLTEDPTVAEMRETRRQLGYRD